MAFKAGAIYGEASLDSKKWMSGLSNLQKTTALTVGAITAMMVAMTAKTSKAANEYAKELSNVTTLLDEATVSTEELNEAILGMDSTLGTTTELTKGMYQAFSAGAETLDDAMKITVTSAKFAKAGLTDVNTAVDVLTTAMNAYGAEVVSAEQASDIFFTTIKKGKITGEELASSIGTSIPLYASAGIALEELASGLAAMTKQGVNSSNATTQLNAIVNSFLKPSGELVALLDEMGFASGSAFLETEGLAGALELLEEATDGDASALAELLPNIRALRGAMALTGVGGEEFTATLEEMENASGATEKAFAKQEKTWETFLNSAKKAEIQVGLVTKEFVDGLIVALTGVTEWFNNLDQEAIDFIGNFLSIGSVIGTVTLAVIGLKVAFTALAANPVVALVSGVMLLTTGVIALSKSLNDKAIRDASPRFEEIAKSIGVAEEGVEGLVKASISLDKFFEASEMRGAYGAMADESIGFNKQIEELAKRFGVTEMQMIEVALASEKITEEQRKMIEGVKELREEEIRIAQARQQAIAESKEMVGMTDRMQMHKDQQARKEAEIANQLKEQQSAQEAITHQINAQIEAEKTRVAGVIADRTTATKEYNKALETAMIKSNLGLLNEKELLEANTSAAEAFSNALIEIGFNTERGQEGDKQLKATLATMETQKSIMEDIIADEKELGTEAEIANAKIKDSTEETVEELEVTWKDYFNIIQTGYSTVVGDLMALGTQLNRNQQAELELGLQQELQALEEQKENQIITEEEYDAKVLEVNRIANEKMNALKEKQFNADKVNRISGVLQSAASSIMGWWEVAPSLGPVAGPIFAGAMTALTGGTALAQSGAIASEVFVPSMAVGGTASGMTRMNEAGGEIVNLPDGTVIVPNDISRQIANDAGGGTVINVSFAGAKISDDMDLNRITEKVSRKLGRQLRTA